MILPVLPENVFKDRSKQHGTLKAFLLMKPTTLSSLACGYDLLVMASYLKRKNGKMLLRNFVGTIATGEIKVVSLGILN